MASVRLVACSVFAEVLVVFAAGDLAAAIVVGSDSFAEDQSPAAVVIAQDSAAGIAGQWAVGRSERRMQGSRQSVVAGEVAEEVAVAPVVVVMAAAAAAAAVVEGLGEVVEIGFAEVV